ncbi:MAG TPA: DUF1592 domain-containing protein [Planctomycetota bacterium]|nr:DUF1592 domain-containing protein [Planctomycetota bacterium]
MAAIVVLLAICTAAAAAADDYDHTARPVLERYCWKCHDGDEAKGGLDLAAYADAQAARGAGKIWRTVLGRIEAGEMPPHSKAQPSELERRDLVAWIMKERARQPRDPGRVTLHRLNRAEYANTVRDLIGIDLGLTDGFPADDVGDGFDNSAETLSLPPLLFEKYAVAAEQALDVAFDRFRPELRGRLLFAEPEAGLDADDATARFAAALVVRAFADRAFRRPADDRQVASLMTLYDDARARGERYDVAVRTALTAVLVSPRFLFRVEADRPASDGRAYALDAWEVAARLSYFLWSTMPDDELRAFADRGDLADPRQLAGQARRLLTDGRAQALVENFAGQWLQLRKLMTVTPDRRQFPEFDERLRGSMREEALRFVAAIIREDRPILDFIDADFTFLDERLARHYGIAGVEGARFRRVALDPDDGRRGGVLGLASTLTVTSNPTRTSPVKRGKWILSEILGAPPAPPPPDVGDIGDETVVAGLGLRARLEAHRAKPACAGCHDRLDPLGFGFENYDAIGRWRDADGAGPIDSAGTLPNGVTFRGPVELKKLFLARGRDFARSLTEKMLTYALGRGLEEYDAPTVDAIVARLERDEWRFSSLILGVVESYPFRHRRAP